MITFIALFGAALIGYVVYLISGVGVAIMAFFGLVFMLLAIYMWIAHLSRLLYEVKGRVESNTDFILHEIKKAQR